MNYDSHGMQHNANAARARMAAEEDARHGLTEPSPVVAGLHHILSGHAVPLEDLQQMQRDAMTQALELLDDAQHALNLPAPVLLVMVDGAGHVTTGGTLTLADMANALREIAAGLDAVAQLEAKQ